MDDADEVRDLQSPPGSRIDGGDRPVRCLRQATAAAGVPGHYRQWQLVSIVGTVHDIPDTTLNERAYRPGTNTEAKSAYLQARVLCVV